MVAGVFDVGQQVRRQNQVDALVVPEIAHELEHLVAALSGPCRWSARRGNRRSGSCTSACASLIRCFMPVGVGLDVAIARFAEADVEQHFVRALHGVGPRQAGQLAAIRDKGHRVHAGNVRVALRHVADPRADLERRVGDVEPEDAHPSALGHEEPEQRLDHRALAGAVRPEQAHRAGGKRRRHVAQRAVCRCMTVTPSSVTTGRR